MGKNEAFWVISDASLEKKEHRENTLVFYLKS